MLVHDVTPALFLAVAMCGGGAPEPDPEPTSPAGWTCEEIQWLARADLYAARECGTDSDCDQTIPGTGTCATNDVIANIGYDAEFMFHLMDEATAIDCEIDFKTGTYCPETAEPACEFAKCTWVY